MAGIVNPRRELVDQQRAVGEHEELDAEDADIVERLAGSAKALSLAASAVSGEIAAGTVEVCRMPSRWTFSAGS